MTTTQTAAVSATSLTPHEQEQSARYRAEIAASRAAEARDAAVSAAPTAYKVWVSNGAFFSSYLMAASSEQAARAAVEVVANDPRILADEAAMAAQIGEKSAGRYSAYRVEATSELADATPHLLHSGAEG